MSAESFSSPDDTGKSLGRYRSLLWRVIAACNTQPGCIVPPESTVQYKPNAFPLSPSKQDAMDVWALSAMNWDGQDIAGLIDEAEQRSRYA